MLDPRQQKSWDEQGFFIVPGFVGSRVCAAMLERAIQISRDADPHDNHPDFVVMPEQNLADSVDATTPPEQTVSKIFKLHRDGPFADFIHTAEVLDIGRSLLGPSVDCFLSQFIFKNPAAWGQPWHQDAYYFPFDQAPQVGIWLAVTEATLDNGCLWVLPGSHREPIHEHVPDRRPNANYAYVEIVDCDFSAAQPVTMAAGDLLVFHSYLAHRSTDNSSNGLRAAMVYHMAAHGTRDLSNRTSPVNDWLQLPDASGP